MYVLDTNILYYVTGLSICPGNIDRLESFVTQHECCVATTSLFEFICNPKNSVDDLRAVGRYMANKNIMLAVVASSPLPDDFNLDLATITESQFVNLKKGALQGKVEQESKYAAVHFNICLLLGLCFYMADVFSEDYNADRLYSLCLKYSRRNVEYLRAIFAEGYKTNDCGRYVSKAFDDLLKSELAVGLTFLHGMEEHEQDPNFSLDAWATAEQFRSLHDKIENRIIKCETSYKYLQKMAKRYKKKNGKQQYELLLQKTYEVFERRAETDALGYYLQAVLRKIVVEGGAYRKNDYIDAVILSCLDQADALITFDIPLMKVILKRKDSLDKYSLSLSLINSLKIT